MDMTLSNIIIKKLDACVIDSGCHAFDREQRFVAITSNGIPRWIIPLGSSLTKYALSQWTPYGYLSQIKWLVICFFSPYQILLHLPNIYMIKGSTVFDDCSDISTIKNSIDVERFIPVIYVGTPGKQQKAVVSLVCDSTLSPVIVMKIAIGDFATRSLITEANALKTLSIHGFDKAPRIICQKEHLGYTVQSVVGGKLSERKLTMHHIEILLELAVNTPHQCIKYSVIIEQLTRLVRVVSNTDPEAISKDVVNLIDQYLKQVDNDFELPVTFVHGDFAPWNIKVAEKNENMALIDWEDFKPDGLPLWDLCHFCFIQAHLFDEKKWIGCLMESPLIDTYLKRLSINIEHKKTLVCLYLIQNIISPSSNCNDDYHKYLMSNLMQIAGK